jgi:hypothetical protein
MWLSLFTSKVHVKKETTTIRTRGRAHAPRKHPRLRFSGSKKVAELAVTFYRLHLAINEKVDAKQISSSGDLTLGIEGHPNYPATG